MSDSIKIARLRIRNFLGISDVEIVPGHVNQITGQNNASKTSIIKAIEFAAKGSSDPALVRFGAEAAEVTIELADETAIRRRLNANGRQSVEVRNGDSKKTSPQAYLESLFHEAAFNPLELLDPKKRNDAILASIDVKITEAELAEALGLDPLQLPLLDYSKHALNVLEQLHRYYYLSRTELNRELADTRKRYETYAADLASTYTPHPLLSLNEVAAQVACDEAAAAAKEGELERAKAARHQDLLDRKRIDDRRAEIEYGKRTNAGMKAEEEAAIAALKKQHELALQQLESKFAESRAAWNSRIKTLEEEVERATQALPVQLPCPDDISEELQVARLDAEKSRLLLKEVQAFEVVKKNRAMVQDLKEDVESREAFIDHVTKRIEALAGPLKKQVMAQAEMPVENLEYRDGLFYVDGVSVDNLSQSRTMRLAVAVARKLAKKTKIICIDGAEALDAETYEALRLEINNDEYSYFITKVGEPFSSSFQDDVSIEMRDGALVNRKARSVIREEQMSLTV